MLWPWRCGLGLDGDKTLKNHYNPTEKDINGSISKENMIAVVKGNCLAGATRVVAVVASERMRCCKHAKTAPGFREFIACAFQQLVLRTPVDTHLASTIHH